MREEINVERMREFRGLPPGEIMTAKEVAQMLKVSVSWVTNHASGKYKPVLPSRKMGGVVRFLRSEIEEFFERSKRSMQLGIPLQ